MSVITFNQNVDNFIGNFNDLFVISITLSPFTIQINEWTPIIILSKEFERKFNNSPILVPIKIVQTYLYLHDEQICLVYNIPVVIYFPFSEFNSDSGNIIYNGIYLDTFFVTITATETKKDNKGISVTLNKINIEYKTHEDSTKFYAVVKIPELMNKKMFEDIILQFQIINDEFRINDILIPDILVHDLIAKLNTNTMSIQRISYAENNTCFTDVLLNQQKSSCWFNAPINGCILGKGTLSKQNSNNFIELIKTNSKNTKAVVDAIHIKYHLSPFEVIKIIFTYLGMDSSYLPWSNLRNLKSIKNPRDIIVFTDDNYVSISTDLPLQIQVFQKNYKLDHAVILINNSLETTHLVTGFFTNETCGSNPYLYDSSLEQEYISFDWTKAHNKKIMWRYFISDIKIAYVVYTGTNSRRVLKIQSDM